MKEANMNLKFLILSKSARSFYKRLRFDVFREEKRF